MVTNVTNINKRTTTSLLKLLNRKKDQDTILVWIHISTVRKLSNHMSSRCRVLWCPLRFPHKKTIFRSSLLPCVLLEVHVLSILFVVIYANLCSTRLSYQMIYVLFISNTTGATSGTDSAPLMTQEIRTEHPSSTWV
jgi:hypothetical protein